MARIAAASEAGTRKQVNEDSCCVHVARSPLGEVAMAVVCDGVGGLAAGNLASATVVTRFSEWFEHGLSTLMLAMPPKTFDVAAVRDAWEALLQTLNSLIRIHGERTGLRMGTTFTGVIACAGRYLVGHVGDCRAYRVSEAEFEQMTEDQSAVARRLRRGEITPDEAAKMPSNVILQAVGAQPALAPAYYEGSHVDGDLFVICCDGAWRRAGNEGVRALFQHVTTGDETSLQRACEALLAQDMAAGEKDNLTVACLSMAEATAQPAGETRPRATGVAAGAQHGDEDELATMVESVEDELATVVEGADEDEDGLATAVEADEDELPTMVGGTDEPTEDDLPTMVEGAGA